MDSNFSFLRADWPELFEEAHAAERNARIEPRVACILARRTLELLVRWLYDAEASLRRPGQNRRSTPDLNALLHEPSFVALVGSSLLTKANIIRQQGNEAVHGRRRIDRRAALDVVRELFHFSFWVGDNYARTDASRPDAELHFDLTLIPERQADMPPAQTLVQVQQLADDLARRDAELFEERQRSTTLDAEIEQLRQEVEAAKAARRAHPVDHDYDEAATRDLYIDLLLEEAGWHLDAENVREFPVTGMPNKSGQGFVDYVLWGDDGKPLAVVEAKETRLSAQRGQEQALQYANCLEAAYGQRPLICYTNGYEHWFWDDQNYAPRRVEGFRTKDELQLLIQRRSTLKLLSTEPVNHEIVNRFYQQRAIRRIAEDFEEARRRQALLVMATGTGKTRTVIALVELLRRCNWINRVLFLADRQALVTQAVKAFKRHLPDSVPVNLLEERVTSGSQVCVSTYQTMMNLIDNIGRSGRKFGVGHFDLVIIDEAHRSVYQKYGAIFTYFDSLLVGLTATPRNEIDRNTYRLFELEDGVPTDYFGLDEAIERGYLVPPKAASVPLRFQREGIRYADLSEEEKEQWDAQEWNDDGTIPDFVDPDDVGKWLMNKDTVDKVLATLMAHGIKVAGGDRLGKTIIFAKNQAHADFIMERFNANYPEHRGGFARVITHETRYSQSLIDDFAKKGSSPHIAISVDMLDTGIDIPEVVNLVFFKIVRSKTKFWQMIGRGTRLCSDLFGPGLDKTEFRLFDFCGNLEFFGANPDPATSSIAQPLSQRLFLARLELLAGLDARRSDSTVTVPQRVAEEERKLRDDIATSLHQIVAGMSADSFTVRPHRRFIDNFEARAAWDQLGPNEFADLGRHLSGLPSKVMDDDEQAKRFDLLIYRAQLCTINTEPGFVQIREAVQEIADNLLSKTNIPAVRDQQVFLEAVTEDRWWQDVTLPMLEQARVRMRSLIRLLDKKRQRIVYTDFQDQLGEIEEVEMTGRSAQVDLARFKEKVRTCLAHHDDHLSMQRLRRNFPLTQSDLDELHSMLVDGCGIDESQLQAATEEHGLGLFIRSLVGLEAAAVTEALSEFVIDVVWTANQIEFIQMVTERLTRHGCMTEQQLYEPPFTDVAPRGPDVIFPQERLNVLVTVLREVNRRATAS